MTLAVIMFEVMASYVVTMNIRTVDNLFKSHFI